MRSIIHKVASVSDLPTFGAEHVGFCQTRREKSMSLTSHFVAKESALIRPFDLPLPQIVTPDLQIFLG